MAQDIVDKKFEQMEALEALEQARGLAKSYSTERNSAGAGIMSSMVDLSQDGDSDFTASQQS